MRVGFPYLIVAFVLSGFAGWAYGDGLLGVPETYALGMLAVLIACPAVVRGEQPDHERRSKRR